MIRQWLPHLIVGLLALSAGAFGSWLLSSNDEEWREKERYILGGFEHEEGNSTVVEARLPPRPMIAWATFFFVGTGGFYLAAALAGWVHRSEA
jgi:hypothetical protein